MRSSFFFLIFLLTSTLSAQERIALENPSFEDVPRAGWLPQGWNDANCGPENQTPPDIHPNDMPPYDFFGVKKRALDGWTYLGMVVRSDGTNEAVTQKLASPLEAGSRYLFSLYLAQSPTYVSGVAGDPFRQVAFTTPAVLRIWGGASPCERGELLALTTAVDNANWLEFLFTLQPEQAVNYLTFDVWYEGEEPINGHILIDNCSDLLLLPSPPAREALEAMDAAALEGAIFDMQQKYRASGLMIDRVQVPRIGVCLQTKELEEKIAQQGLRRFVLDTPFEEITSYIRSMEAVRAGKNLALLKETTRLSRLNSREISPEEYQYFENADRTWRENEALEPLQAKRREFIQLHRSAVIDELSML